MTEEVPSIRQRYSKPTYYRSYTYFSRHRNLTEALTLRINEQRCEQGKPIIAFDGKVLRGSYRNDKKSAVQLVTAYDTEQGLVLCQKLTETKNGELSIDSAPR